jgi:signal transduction histidine kinase
MVARRAAGDHPTAGESLPTPPGDALRAVRAMLALGSGIIPQTVDGRCLRARYRRLSPIDGDTPTARRTRCRARTPKPPCRPRTPPRSHRAAGRRRSRPVAHDLRQPVSAALVTADFLDELLVTRAPVEVLRRYTALIRRSMHHALRLSNDLLTFGQLDSGTLLLDRGPTDVGALLHEVAQLLEADARSRRVTVHVSCGEMSRAHLDRHRMLRVLWNLCENAVRHTPAGGDVHLSAGPDEMGIRIAVSDSGPGVDESQLTQLFDWYWQADRVVHRSGAGPGARYRPLARRVARRGGRGGESARRVGLVVVLTLPAGQ